MSESCAIAPALPIHAVPLMESRRMPLPTTPPAVPAQLSQNARTVLAKRYPATPYQEARRRAAPRHLSSAPRQRAEQTKIWYR